VDLKSRIKKIFPQIFSIAIIFISVIFHYQIHIENAISNTPTSEFGINISIWRIIFEPFIGLLLFFNRALYALDEMPILLIWILIIFILYTIYKLFFVKEKKRRIRFIISQIANLPLVIGLWFSFFAILIFIPLPNNTIENNSTNKILVTTHSHTEFSHDGLISQIGLWKWHKRNNFDAFFITDHNNHAKTLEFVKSQRNGSFPGEPLVMCGEEFSGSNHLSLLGLKKNFSTKGKSDSAVVDLVRQNKGVVLVNHWFDGEKKPLKYFTNLGVDGFEITNSATDRSYDRKVYQRIKKFCESNNLIMNGGLDFHGYGNVCSIWNAMEIPNWKSLTSEEKEEAILEIIRERNQNAIEPLVYNDRPYYDKENLSFAPLFTFVNYFRTLNFYQLFSWIFWIAFISFVNAQLSKNEKVKKLVSANILVPLFGALGGALMLKLAYAYYSNLENIIGYSDVFEEYSQLLFFIGSALFFYSITLSIFRIMRIIK
jgi:hypothetical protein